MKTTEEYLRPYYRSYKDPSDRDSYSEYREGYSDAMDIASQIIEQAQKDAYNQAIDDCCKIADESPYHVSGSIFENFLKLKK